MRQFHLSVAVVLLSGLSTAFAQQAWSRAQTDILGYRPSIAANRLRGEYLTVWQESGNGFDIHGRLSRANNVFIGAEFVICYAPGDQALADVAFDAASRRYLVVWADQRLSTTTRAQIFGQLVSETGALIGGNFAILSGWSNDYRSPSIASDGNGTFLVVALEYVSSDGRWAHAAYVTSAGWVRSNRRISQLGGSWVDQPDDPARRTAVGADPQRRAFVATWVEKDVTSPTNKNIAYRRLGGSTIEYQCHYASTAAGNEAEPSVSCDPQYRRTLIAWSTPGATQVQVQGRFVDTTDLTELGAAFGIASGRFPAVSNEPNGSYIVVWRQYVFNPQLPWYQQYQIRSRKVGRLGTLYPISFVDYSCTCCGPDVAANHASTGSDGACYGKQGQGHAVWQAYSQSQ